MTIKEQIEASIDVKKLMADDVKLQEQIQKLINWCYNSLKEGGKIIFAGNGGSFADAQHLTAEFISRLQFDRAALASLALGTNSSSMSAIGNDYGYDQVFAREIIAMGSEKDIFIPITTSGNSPNILEAVIQAKKLNIKTMGLTGSTGGKLISSCECICVPSLRTERIQEAHILIGHIVCGLVENLYFKK